MNWYYVDQGQQAGPVDDTQLEQLRLSGKIQPDTLIWREGMANWAPYKDAMAPSAPPPGAVPSANPAAANQVRCVQCGGMFPPENTIRYGTVNVCAACKPIFMQKLAEGAQVNTGEMRYAGFWVRFGAKFIDGLILRVAMMPLGFLIGGGMRPSTTEGIIGMEVLAGGIGIIIAMLYNVFMNVKYGATLGKMACKIKIVTAEGEPLTYGRAFGRYFAELLSGCFTIMIGYIMAGFDEQKRALHDRICNTRVIYK